MYILNFSKNKLIPVHVWELLTGNVLFLLSALNMARGMLTKWLVSSMFFIITLDAWTMEVIGQEESLEVLRFVQRMGSDCVRLLLLLGVILQDCVIIYCCGVCNNG